MLQKINLFLKFGRCVGKRPINYSFLSRSVTGRPYALTAFSTSLSPSASFHTWRSRGRPQYTIERWGHSRAKWEWQHRHDTCLPPQSLLPRTMAISLDYKISRIWPLSLSMDSTNTVHSCIWKSVPMVWSIDNLQKLLSLWKRSHTARYQKDPWTEIDDRQRRTYLLHVLKFNWPRPKRLLVLYPWNLLWFRSYCPQRLQNLLLGSHQQGLNSCGKEGNVRPQKHFCSTRGSLSRSFQVCMTFHLYHLCMSGYPHPS